MAELIRRAGASWPGRLLRAALVVYAATLAGVVLAQVLWPLPQDLPARADAIFCLGAGMEDDPSPLPDDTTRARAQACARLHAEGVAPLVVFTGAGNDTSSAAEAMAAVARAEGMPPEAMIVEPRAHSTLQNAAFGLALMPAPPVRLVIVSDAFHLPRASVIFRVLGDAELSLYATENTGSVPLRTRIGWSLREAVVIWVNVGRLATYAVAGAMGVERDTRIGWFN